MEVLQHYSLTRFMGFVPAIRKHPGEWWIVEVSLTGKTSHNAAYIAMKLKDTFEGKEGVLFICNTKAILVLAHMGKDVNEQSLLSGIHDKLPQHSCEAHARDVTPDGLLKIQLRLQEFEEEKKIQPSASPLLATKQDRRERVVMVGDDDKLIRSLIHKTFQTKATILDFKDTNGVVEAYLESLPDVVFLDIHLPGGSGIDILAEIFGYDDTAYVVLLSADSVKDNVLTAKSLGAKGFIAKPFTLEKLESCYKQCPTVTRQGAAKAGF